LVKYNIAPCKIHIDFGYSIDYEEEKEDYEVDEEDKSNPYQWREYPLGRSEKKWL
jgi:hypothetical protein